jgi:molybdopterin synthase catalytic subunit
MFRITRTPIGLESLVRAVRDPEAGAVVTFLGTTRNQNAGRRVVRLEYEAFGSMARREMQQLAAVAVRRWGLRRVAMVHRVGIVPVGQASVGIAVSAGHRAEAFAACRWLIDRLKEIVPIWKREHFRGGQIWIGPQQSAPAAARRGRAARRAAVRDVRRERSPCFVDRASPWYTYRFHAAQELPRVAPPRAPCRGLRGDAMARRRGRPRGPRPGSHARRGPRTGPFLPGADRPHA